MAVAVTERYLEQLSDTDLDRLGTAAGLAPPQPEGAAAYLRSHPDLLEPALASPAAFQQFFPGVPSGELRLDVSPFLLFAVAVHRGVADLGTSSFVAEPFGGWKRIPVFDTPALRTHFDDPGRRLYAVEHLASFTRVTSGPLWVRGPDGRARRVRYSEIDPTRLAAVLDLVDEETKPGIYRRLGDLALFLTGVFPDWTARTPAAPLTVERLLRSVRDSGEDPAFGLGDVDALAGSAGLGGLLATLGPRWYRAAARRAPLPTMQRALDDAASGFEKARRFLTLVTDRYLFPLRDRWFGSPA